MIIVLYLEYDNSIVLYIGAKFYGYLWQCLYLEYVKSIILNLEYDLIRVR